MKNSITIYILTLSIILIGCISKQRLVDSDYKKNCFNQLDVAVDNCKNCSVDSIDYCFNEHLDLDTIKDIDAVIWRDYAHAKGLYDHEVLDKSKELVNQLIGVTEDPSLLLERAKVLQLRGQISYRNNELLVAAEDYYKSADIYQKLGLPKEASACYLDITNIQYKIGNYQIAIENGRQAGAFTKAIKNRTHGDSLCLISVYNTVGLAFHERNQLDSAMKYFEFSNILTKDAKEEFWMGLVNGNMSKILRRQGRLQEAFEKVSIDLKISFKYKEFESAANSLLSAGNIYLSLNKPSKARLYYDSAYNLMQKVDSKTTWLIYYKTMATYSRTQKKFKEADEYFQRYIVLRDSLHSISAEKSLEKIHNQNYIDRQLADINLLKIENSYNTKQVRLWQVCIGAIVSVLILLFTLYRNNKKHNEKLVGLNSDLESKVKYHTAELIKTNKELDTYLYRASHDVRRPILTIIGLVKIAELTKCPNELVDIRQKITSTALLMDKMLDKLKMTYGLRAPIELQTFNLSQYFENLVETMHKLYPSAQFQLQKSDDIWLSSDTRFVDMVFSNIVENACIFNNTDSSIHISFDEDDKFISVNIEDNGMGIPEEHKHEIFEAYTRLSEKSIGSGIGLYIVSKALSKIGGNVKFNSNVDEGSIFKIKLPRMYPSYRSN
jgi:signal transduction histidine kinase